MNTHVSRRLPDTRAAKRTLSVSLVFLFAWLCVSAEPVPPSIVQQANHLRAILRVADEAYFEKRDSIMEDEAYDALRRQYENLVARYPDLDQDEGVGSEKSAGPVRMCGRFSV